MLQKSHYVCSPHAEPRRVSEREREHYYKQLKLRLRTHIAAAWRTGTRKELATYCRRHVQLFDSPVVDLGHSQNVCVIGVTLKKVWNTTKKDGRGL